MVLRPTRPKPATSESNGQADGLLAAPAKRKGRGGEYLVRVRLDDSGWDLFRLQTQGSEADLESIS